MRKSYGPDSERVDIGSFCANIPGRLIDPIVGSVFCEKQKEEYNNMQKIAKYISLLIIFSCLFTGTVSAAEMIVDDNAPLRVDYEEYVICAQTAGEGDAKVDELVEINFDVNWNDLSDDEKEGCIADIIWRAEIGEPLTGPLQDFLCAWSADDLRAEMERHGNDKDVFIFASQGKLDNLEAFGYYSPTPLYFGSGYIFEGYEEPIEGHVVIRMIITNPELVDEDEEQGPIFGAARDYSSLYGVESFKEYLDDMPWFSDRIDDTLELWKGYVMIGGNDDRSFHRVRFNIGGIDGIVGMDE